MDLKTLLDTPPWDWPIDAGRMFQKILIDRRANESDRLVSAELAGDLTAINDDLADTLLTVVCSADEPDQLRATDSFVLTSPELERPWSRSLLANGTVPNRRSPRQSDSGALALELDTGAELWPAIIGRILSANARLTRRLVGSMVRQIAALSLPLESLNRCIVWSCWELKRKFRFRFFCPRHGERLPGGQ